MTPEQERLVIDNMRLVGAVVRDKIRKGVPQRYSDEMYDEGQLALVRAAIAYKKGGAKFSTFAYSCIARAITSYLRKSDMRNFDRDGKIKPVRMPKCGKPGTEQFKRAQNLKRWDREGRPSRLDINAIRKGLMMAGCP